MACLWNILRKKNAMITDHEIGSILMDELPKLDTDRISTAEKVSVYQNIKRFADFTCRLIDQRNAFRVAGCFRLAERLFQEGSATTQNAIDSIFIYAVTTRAQALAGLRSLMPAHVRNEYYRQLNSSGI